MVDPERPGADEWVPANLAAGRAGIRELEHAAQDCRRCELAAVRSRDRAAGWRGVPRCEGHGRWVPVRVGAERGAVLDDPAGGSRVLITAHPSAVLRLRGKDGFDEAFDPLVADLASAKAALH